AARATNSEPMAPCAPALLTTTKVCPSCSPIFCAIKRANKSLPPPGAVGTTIVTGRSGHAAWAIPDANIRLPPTNANETPLKDRERVCISSPCINLFVQAAFRLQADRAAALLRSKAPTSPHALPGGNACNKLMLKPGLADKGRLP